MNHATWCPGRSEHAVCLYPLGVVTVGGAQLSWRLLKTHGTEPVAELTLTTPGPRTRSYAFTAPQLAELAAIVGNADKLLHS